MGSIQDIRASKSPSIYDPKPTAQRPFVTTTLKALEDRTAAESRLISMGVLSPMRRSSQDDEWEAARIKACQEARRTGLLTRLVCPPITPRDPDQT